MTAAEQETDQQKAERMARELRKSARYAVNVAMQRLLLEVADYLEAKPK